MEAEIRIVDGLKPRKKIDFASYVSLDEKYYTGERKDIEFIYVSRRH